MLQVVRRVFELLTRGINEQFCGNNKRVRDDCSSCGALYFNNLGHQILPVASFIVLVIISRLFFSPIRNSCFAHRGECSSGRGPLAVCAPRGVVVVGLSASAAASGTVGAADVAIATAVAGTVYDIVAVVTGGVPAGTIVTGYASTATTAARACKIRASQTESCEPIARKERTAVQRLLRAVPR